MVKSQVILASKSPRRRELFKQICTSFEVMDSGVDELAIQKEPLLYYAERLARAKAIETAKKHPDCLVIGCDTVVVFENDVLGKPKDKEDLRKMLNLLSGKTHKVITGVCFSLKGKTSSFSQTTYVTFYDLTKREIEDYIATEEPWDKAGGYAIQGFGALFVKEIKGDYYNVVGLPLARCKRELDIFLKKGD